MMNLFSHWSVHGLLAFKISEPYLDPKHVLQFIKALFSKAEVYEKTNEMSKKKIDFKLTLA